MAEQTPRSSPHPICQLKPPHLPTPPPRPPPSPSTYPQQQQSGQ
jgi:hypothetical protein